MRIPNVREKIVTPLFRGTYGDNGPYENAYWEGNLNEANKKELATFDLTVELLDSWFDNIGCYFDVNVKPKKLEVLHEDFKCFAEGERNNFVVSMIEYQDEETE